jgi:hypothetical protein
MAVTGVFIFADVQEGVEGVEEFDVLAGRVGEKLRAVDPVEQEAAETRERLCVCMWDMGWAAMKTMTNNFWRWCLWVGAYGLRHMVNF